MLLPLSHAASLAALLLLPLSQAQQFSNLPLPVSWPGLSDPCFNALNTTVSCSAVLNRASTSNARLSPTDLTNLCVDSCLTSLNNVRQTIQQACTNATDKILYDDITYPATYIADRFLYAYKLSCRRDPATNQFCDTLLVSWLNQPSLTSAQNCSDCLLGADQTQLNSPFGYDVDFASDFQSKTLSCSATGYPFTVPAAYSTTSSTSSTTGTAATPTTTCATPYTVQSGDNCNSIAQAKNVSTFSVINVNGLNPNCDNLVAGAIICLASPCNLYLVQSTDTCDGIIQAQGTTITGTQLLAWNPDINSLCGNLYKLQGNYICVSPPGGSLGNVVPTSTLAVSTPVSPVPKPTNAPNESNSRCGKWYTVQDGDYCDKVSVQFGIALSDFYFLNPEINSNCTNLLLGLAYCIQAVGSIATYSGYSTSQYFSLTSANYTTTALTTVTDYPAPVYTTDALLPLASGSLTNCVVNRNYRVIPAIMDQSQSPDMSLFKNYINSCEYLAGTYGVSITNLLSWNPSFNASNCTMQAGNSYCVNLNQPSNTTAVLGPDCTQVDTIHPGTISSCSCFTTVFGYDNGSYPCDGVASDFKITLSQLTTWNPWVGSNCDTGLYAGLGSFDQNAVCVGVNSTAPTASATSGPAASSTAGAAPTQTGIVSSCTKYYTAKSGDSCSGIAAMFTITFDQFYAWNPAVGSTCASLWVGYGYCVAAPSPTSVPATATTSTAPAPTRSGTPADCTAYYTVISGDSCQKIQTTFNITFTQLYTWNPSIGANCESLWVGYSICVGRAT